MAQIAACRGTCVPCLDACGREPLPRDYPWSGPNPPGGPPLTNFDLCSEGVEQAVLEQMGQAYCSRYVRGCCARDDDGEALVKDLGGGASLAPGSGDPSEMNCKLLVGR